jgi:Protein of unknown function (DUF3047)
MRFGLVILTLTLSTLASAEAEFLVEDWTSQSLGSVGVPSGWTGESFGRRAFYDLAIEADRDRRVLHLKSLDEHSTISKDITGKVQIRATPVLEWTWKVAVLPIGGDLREAQTSDLPIQLYVVWPRFPTLVRSRVIGYVWDANAPVGLVTSSRKTARVTFIVLRSGSEDLGRWVPERRNVAEDYQRIFGEPPDDPRIVTISIDSNDTHSSAEAFVGPIRFMAE